MRPFLALLLGIITLNGSAQRFYFENVSVSDGLPASKIYAVLQDSTGLVWLGTESGLASYDGLNVISFGTNAGMAPGGVRSLFIDSEKRLWCGHLGGGISVSQGRRFRTVVPADKPLTADVTAIAQDATGAIWIGTFGMGILRLKDLPAEGPVQLDRFEEGKGPGERITSIVRRKNGDLVLLEAGSGLHLWSASKAQFTDYPENALVEQQRITSYFEGSDGSFWVGTQEHGAIRFDPKTKRSTSYDLPTGMPSSFVYAFGEDELGHVWIGTWDAGLVRVDNDGLQLFNRSNGLHSQTIRALSRDREGNLLIATNDEGLEIFKGDRFRAFTDEDGLVERHVWAVAEATDGRVWFGTNGGITILDPKSSGPMSVQKLTVQNGDLTSNSVRVLLNDGSGRMWIGTENGGLLEANTNGGRPVPHSELSALLGNNKVTALARCPTGGIYVGTVGGLIRLVPDGVPSVLRNSDGLAGNDVTALFNDSKGNTWVGTASSGVSIISKGITDKATPVDIGQIITPTSFTEDHSGRIWVGTNSQGVVVLENRKVEASHNIESGLLSNNVRSLITDPNGHIWIGTNLGLNERKKDGGTFLAFTGRSGFTGIEANPGAACRTRSGDLWFGTVHGADYVVIDHGEERTELPLIAVRVLKVNLEERDAIDGVDLSHTERDVRIEYGCVSLSDQGAVRYQFMLEGLEKDWQPVTAETDAHYPGLTPGKYVFRVKARNRSGLWSEPVLYHFTVLPPWYKTWWFYAIMVLITGSSIWTYVKFRERQLRLRNIVLEQKVEERTAEVVAQSKEIEGQKGRIEDLLLNILPKEISEELKEKGKATARRHEEVTVMFTDMKGFTRIAEKMLPEELVSELDDCFIRFDDIIGRYGLEKIKTIGDSYMCAGGVPTSDPNHASKSVLAALEVRELMSAWKREREAKGKEPWVLRIGVHTGPVVAGVVGKRKFAYDIWGDTVNTASRMESSGEAGEVNISGSTYALVKDQFECVPRGQVEAKNKGRIDMYFVTRIKPEFSANKEGTQPNERLRKLCGIVERAQDLA
ncbi:MAG TPA: adenylate/guanylate cyclase domain-containing protein [Flavobacteriales bacterium]|nr:adenylate/guanylate cyclase domain-containing protein [Flavobacteriales bacterium]